MHKLSIRFLLNLGRIILLILMATAVLVVSIWICSPKWINQADNYIVQKYNNAYLDQLKTARGLLLKGDVDDGREIIEELLNDLDDIEKRDRLGPIKRSGFKLITETLKKSGHNEKAISWYERWIGFDEMDVYARSAHALLLSRMSGHSNKGEMLLRDLANTYPYDVALDSYYSMIMKRGESDEETANIFAKAFLIFLASFDKINISIGWEIFWDTGQGFNETQKKEAVLSWDDDIRMKIKCDLPPNVKNVRIDLPQKIQLCIKKPLFILHGNNTEFSDTDPRTNYIEQPSEDTFLGIHNSAYLYDPNFIWHITDNTVFIQPSDGEFTCFVFPVVFSYIDKMKLADSVGKKLQSIGAGESTDIFIKGWKTWQEVTLGNNNKEFYWYGKR